MNHLDGVDGPSGEPPFTCGASKLLAMAIAMASKLLAMASHFKPSCNRGHLVPLAAPFLSTEENVPNTVGVAHLQSECNTSPFVTCTCSIR